MLLIDFIAGAAIAACSGMGVGGGGLLVLYLVYARGMGQIEAQGMNLIFFLIAGIAALCLHSRRRSFGAPLFPAAASGMAGTAAGVYVLGMADPAVVRRVFGALMLASAGIELYRSLRPAKGNMPAPERE